MMITSNKLEQLARQVQESLPKGIRDLGEDMEKKIRQILQNQFNRMDLVSREKFDIQTQVLLRTREKLNQLELRLNALETIPKSNPLVSPEISAGTTAVAPVSGVKTTEVSDVNETISVSLAKKVVSEISDTDEKLAKDTFEKL